MEYDDLAQSGCNLRFYGSRSARAARGRQEAEDEGERLSQHKTQPKRRAQENQQRLLRVRVMRALQPNYSCTLRVITMPINCGHCPPRYLCYQFSRNRRRDEDDDEALRYSRARRSSHRVRLASFNSHLTRYKCTTRAYTFVNYCCPCFLLLSVHH